MNNDIKYKLANAMKECMFSSPVEKITVKEICDTCGVTRQTFYRNFQDKYDLINWDLYNYPSNFPILQAFPPVH